MTAAPWTSCPVFVISTFHDIQAERDPLRNHVFPLLEERLRAASQLRTHRLWTARNVVALPNETNGI